MEKYTRPLLSGGRFTRRAVPFVGSAMATSAASGVVVRRTDGSGTRVRPSAARKNQAPDASRPVTTA